MLRGNVFSGAAFRVTLYATAILVAVTVAMATYGYRTIQTELYGQIQGQVGTLVETLRTAHQDGGDEGLAARAKGLAAGMLRNNQYLNLFDRDGQKLIGSLNVVPDFDGWARRTVQSDTPEEFYLFATRVGTHTLVVAVRLAEIHRIEIVFIRSLAAITAFLAILFITLGYITSRLVEDKLEGMSRTLEQVGGGDTGARLKISDANDQIDRVSRRMNTHLEQLSGLMVSTKSSAAAIAHDLKRPLARALLGVDRAMDQVEAGKNPHVALEDTRAELANLTGIFETILRIARIESGHAEGLRGTVDLADLARDLGETFDVVAEESGQSLGVLVPDGAAPVRGDAGMLSQMLVNLLQNAVNYGPPGNHITLSVVQAGGQVTLSVADTGPGIALDDRDRVLTPFFRADTARTTEGNGLGLALVKSVADRHGASLTLGDNAPGLVVTAAFAAP